MKKHIHNLKLFVLLFASATLVGCASPMKPVPLKVYSEPQGGYILLKVDEGNEATSPWMYLGTTPLETTYTFDANTVRRSNKISMRILKEGYFEQTKDWSPENFKEEAEDRNMIFWNPHLAESKKR